MFERSKKVGYLIDAEVYGEVTDEQLKQCFKQGMVIDLFDVPGLIAKHLDPESRLRVQAISFPDLSQFIQERMKAVFPGFTEDSLVSIPGTEKKKGYRIPAPTG